MTSVAPAASAASATSRLVVSIETRWPAAAEALDHRDGAVELLGGGHGLRARARGRSADVENRGALRHQLEAVLLRGVRVEEAPAVGERVGGDVDDAHDRVRAHGAEVCAPGIIASEWRPPSRRSCSTTTACCSTPSTPGPGRDGPVRAPRQHLHGRPQARADRHLARAVGRQAGAHARADRPRAGAHGRAARAGDGGAERGRAAPPRGARAAARGPRRGGAGRPRVELVARVRGAGAGGRRSWPTATSTWS